MSAGHVYSVFVLPKSAQGFCFPFSKQSGINWALMGFKEGDLMGTRCPLHPFLPFRTGAFPLGRTEGKIGQKGKLTDRDGWRTFALCECENRGPVASDWSTSDGVSSSHAARNMHTFGKNTPNKSTSLCHIHCKVKVRLNHDIHIKMSL